MPERTATSNRFERRGASGLLLAASLLLCLAAAELVARALYRPALDPTDYVRWDDTDFTPPVNREGFREAPLTPEIAADSYTRIVFLGDSFTFGWGVERGEDRFSDLIEARLNEEARAAGSDARYHIYNAGIPASNPYHWRRHIERFLGYRPSFVFAVFFLRDGTSLHTSMIVLQDMVEGIRSKYSGTALYRHSYLVRTFLEERVRREFQEEYLRQFHLAYLGDDEQRKVWRIMQKMLVEMKEICERNGIGFHLVIFPLLFSLDDYQYHEVDREIEAFAGRSGILVFSLTPAFLVKEEEELWVSRFDQHPNERGHAIAADALFAYVREVVGADRRRSPAPADGP